MSQVPPEHEFFFTVGSPEPLCFVWKVTAETGMDGCLYLRVGDRASRCMSVFTVTSGT